MPRPEDGDLFLCKFGRGNRLRRGESAAGSEALAMAFELEAVADDVDFLAVDAQVVGHVVGVVVVERGEGADFGGALAEQLTGLLVVGWLQFF